MLREGLIHGLDHDPHFQWRGENVTRIENLSDIAFALSLSMLVAGSGAPQTYQDLGRFLFSIIPVAAGFVFLLGLWHSHFTFFRRYGVADNYVITINAALIFVVLYIAYPLRFAFDCLLAFIFLQFGKPSMMMDLGITQPDMAGVIIAYFNTGFAISLFLLALMYRHALKKREILALTDHEANVTKRAILTLTLLGALAALTATLAYFTPLHGMAGLVILIFGFLPFFISRRKYPNIHIEITTLQE